MAWVVGLISPISLGLLTVNQRLPSGPAVISFMELSPPAGAVNSADGVGGRVDHPDLAGSCAR